MNFGFQNGPKTEEKILKTRCAETIHFWINCYWNFLRFGLRKWKENSLFFGSLSKKPILWKSLLFQRKITMVLNFQTWTKFRCNFFSAITSENMALKSNLGIDFGFPKPSKSTPKAMLNEACFATLCNPPGSRRKLTDRIAFGLPKRLRIWLGLLYLSIYLYLYLYLYLSLSLSIYLYI